MIFIESALLKQPLPMRIDNKYRDGPVQYRFYVGFHLFHSSYGIVLFVDQNYVVFSHYA
jgi:hypothetical protein